jgi:hypothetical protein
VTVTNTIATTTTVASSANPSVVGQTVTYTATVTQASGATKPTGTVTFKDGSSAITCAGGTQTLSNGTATCSLSYPTTGSHSITAVYGGAGVFTGSTSSPLVQAVNPASTTTTLASSTNPSVTGQSVTFTATVAVVAPGSGTPTGTVTFKDGSTTLSCTGNQTLDASGQATCTVPFSSAGAKSVVATYGGSTNHLSSSSASLSQNVNSASTTTTVSSSGLSSVTWQSVTYTATVAPVSPGTGTPTGSVAFKDGAGNVTGCGTQPLSGGVATCVVTYSSTGSHQITAVYAGTADFTTSTSSSITQVVSAASTTTTLSTSGSPSVTGQTVTFTATVAPVAPGSGTPTGSVAFKDGGTGIPGCGAQSLNGSGVATCQVTFNAVSAGRTISATYAGTPDYASSSSANLTQVINKASTTTALTTSKSPEKSNTPVTFTAAVTATSPGAGTPTGSVTFKDGASTISCSGGAQTLNGSGIATCQVTYASASLHNISAVYSGDSNYSTSTSATLTQRVVNSAVTGLGFTNVTVTPNGGSASPVTLNSSNCTGLGTSNVVCTISAGNSASLAADVQFVNASNSLSAYSAESVQGSSAIETKAGTTNGTVTFATIGSGSPRLTGTKSGNDHVYFTVTYADGANTFAATLKMN